jgi:Flp pilus assembly protein TadD
VLLFWSLSAAGCLHAGLPLASQTGAPGEDNAPVLEPRQAADIKVAMGRTLEQSGDLEQAQTVYREALKLDPSRGDACGRLAVLYDQQGKWAESEELYRKAHALQGDTPALLCNRGYSLYLQGRHAEAEKSLRQAIALDPDNRRAHTNLGLTLASLERTEEALAEFRRAGCNEVEAHANLGLSLALSGCWLSARAHYEQALAVNPKCIPARNGLKALDSLIAKANATSSPPVCQNEQER